MVRAVAESLGAIAALGLHALAFIAFAAGAGLLDEEEHRRLYWMSILAAYLAMLGLAWTPLVGPSRRRRFDAWLVAMVPAFVVTGWMIVEKWPLHFAFTTAHGFGPSGGEANAVFLPWLHLAAWWAVGWAWTRRVTPPRAPDRPVDTASTPASSRRSSPSR